MEAPVAHLEIVDGKPVIAGRNLKIAMIAALYIKAGASIDAIMEQYQISRAEVHAARAYYYDNLDYFEAEDRAVQPLINAKAETEARLAQLRARQ